MEIETTIQIKRSLKEKLKGLKRHTRESFESVIARLMDMAVDDEPLSAEDIKDIINVFSWPDSNN